MCTCCAVDEMVEQQGHLRLSCYLGDHAANQLIWLQQLSSHALLAQPIHQVVGNLHAPWHSQHVPEKVHIVLAVSSDYFESPCEHDDLCYRQMPADQYQQHGKH